MPYLTAEYGAARSRRPLGLTHGSGEQLQPATSPMLQKVAASLATTRRVGSRIGGKIGAPVVTKMEGSAPLLRSAMLTRPAQQLVGQPSGRLTNALDRPVEVSTSAADPNTLAVIAGGPYVPRFPRPAQNPVVLSGGMPLTTDLDPRIPDAGAEGRGGVSVDEFVGGGTANILNPLHRLTGGRFLPGPTGMPDPIYTPGDPTGPAPAAPGIPGSVPPFVPPPSEWPGGAPASVAPPIEEPTNYGPWILGAAAVLSAGALVFAATRKKKK